ncbi:hypothetical protein BGZ73_008230, partial [Actinomortierella ambigua]
MDATATVMESCEVYSSRLTHSGRHAGCSEAYNRGLSMDDIRHLGRWSMGQMENFYAPKNPTRGAFCLAHFAPNEPYILERDLVTPPIDLQRLLFPWIESNFDDDMSEKATSWREECVKEMKGIDPNVATDEDIFWESKGRRTLGEFSRSLSTDSLITRVGFLKLLVRLRRVILQDAALFLKPASDGRSLKNGLLDGLSEIFDSKAFRDFQQSLLDAIAASQQRASIISSNVTLNSETVVDALNTLAQKQSTIVRQQGTTSREIQELKEGQERLFRLIEGQQSRMHQQQQHFRPFYGAYPQQPLWHYMPQQSYFHSHPQRVSPHYPQHVSPYYPQQQQQQRQQEQDEDEEEGEESEAAKTKGYLMLPDK